jgi:hypothetical protein
MVLEWKMKIEERKEEDKQLERRRMSTDAKVWSENGIDEMS